MGVKRGVPAAGALRPAGARLHLTGMKTTTMVLGGCLVVMGCSRAPSPPAATPATAAHGNAPAPTAAPAAPIAAASLTVTSPAREALIAQGDAAPSFVATTHDGHRVESNGGARERVMVLYFYPRDETPGCTREACSFRDAYSAYTEAGAEIFGVSTDAADSHRGFAQNHQLPYGLIADTDGRLAGAFGVPVRAGFTARTTVVIGRDGHVARVFPDVSVDGHSTEVLAAVRAAR